ncbi:alpha/beta hydrolase [Rhodococcus spelaei]|uniref:Alpha/beta hydrolase n=1 Tax=Rhodococcus spelaei TaxID=2546320 RepID=A0A541B413_9NOCA|nr:alpha/beta hydrolase [Rhodococcus spelaei]TQF67049.1 alpha/beta hydrolase [Rhodococcus spelaei]
MTTWAPDLLGTGYQQLTIPLGADPDGEGTVEATLVRYRPEGAARTRHAVLYVHGFTDYFFQKHLAEHFHEQGYAFYALDLRKCGRSLRAGQTPHFVTDLSFYDEELGRALALVREDLDGRSSGAGGTSIDSSGAGGTSIDSSGAGGTSGSSVLLTAHSTGGLILPLWLDRLNAKPGGSAGAGVRGLILNSPWFDMQGPSLVRSVGTVAVDAVGRVKDRLVIKQPPTDVYGRTLHRDHGGEWDYDLDWKPLTGFPVTFGWLRAVRRGHARLHRGLDVGVPSLILRSKATHYSRRYTEKSEVADLILDVKQIARWAGCLGDRTTIVPIEGARHDVFLSREVPRKQAFDEVDQWLGWLNGQGA